MCKLIQEDRLIATRNEPEAPLLEDLEGRSSAVTLENAGVLG